MFADGKLWLGTEGGGLFVFRHLDKPTKYDTEDRMAKAENQKAANAIRKAEQKKLGEEIVLAKIEFPVAIRTTPVAVGKVLYVATEEKLYAIGKK